MKAGDILKIDISKMTEAERLYYNELIAKYNPYHDARGLFSDRPGASHYSLPKNNPRLLPKEDPPLGVTVHRTSTFNGHRIKGTSINGMPVDDPPEQKPKKPRAPRKPKEKPPEEKPKGEVEVKPFSKDEFAKAQQAVIDKKRSMTPEEQAEAFVNGTLTDVKFTAPEMKTYVDTWDSYKSIGFSSPSQAIWKVNKEYMKETHETLSGLMLEFPEVGKMWTHGMQLDKENRKGTYASAHEYMINIGGVSTVPKKLAEHYESDLKANFHPPGTTYKAVVAHEFAHVVHRQGDRANGMRTREMDYVAAKVVGKKTGDSFISKYAAKNAKETVAESFAEVWQLRDKARPEAKEYVKKLIIEYSTAMGMHKGGTETAPRSYY